MDHIIHPIPPVFDERSRVLVLGSMPSPASRKLGFNYGHPQNRFWRVMARLADEPVPSTNDRKRDFCLRHHIALWDVLASCEIKGASDASIKNALPNDLASIVSAAPIEAVFCTGAKAFELYNKLGCKEACGIDAIKLPSTSPANAACSLDKLTNAYAQIFTHTHEFEPPVLDVEQVVALEHAVADGGTPLSELMDRAGAAVAHRVQQVWNEIIAGTYEKELLPLDAESGEPCVTVLCGNGNNGGDGWVAAELLAAAGIPVCVATTKAPEEISAQPAHDAAVRAQIALEVSSNAQILLDTDGSGVRSVIDRTLIVVDAMFGCGLRGGLSREPYISWVFLANRLCGHHTTIAVDVPSGVSAQDGYGFLQSTPRILADETITMMVPKPGLSARECGKVRVAPLAYIEPLLI
ncbi:MAG: DNA-deoxyinosine glycosylase [Eggerthellaceae bacterium]|nr:DNA-deoxyinosine glycosylase [Eggerthellaceae bacterium]